MRYKCERCDGRGFGWILRSSVDKRKTICIYCNGKGYYETPNEIDAVSQWDDGEKNQIVESYIKLHEKFQYNNPLPDFIPLPENYCSKHRIKMNLQGDGNCPECNNERTKDSTVYMYGVVSPPSKGIEEDEEDIDIGPIGPGGLEDDDVLLYGVFGEE